ncbi:hypothetical protein GCM10017674_79140 [Streptomyces gardneri]|uniref:Uncharacterized protein n=1 Tax=Streptomyces gardneri TaxID=66892 RepID=A0A4Y3RFN8_9ACTN|nr:hypothetical protein SGA01_11220 [Streptomyces gardneri]GHH22946.1 hypothetical protein GCM10017674_79140 [Streptomyces gardneri]
MAIDMEGGDKRSRQHLLPSEQTDPQHRVSLTVDFEAGKVGLTPRRVTVHARPSAPSERWIAAARPAVP